MGLFSCEDKVANPSSNASEGQKKLSPELKQLLRFRIDSLVRHANSLNGPEHYNLVSACLSESLSDALRLNEDSILASIYFKLGGHFDVITDYASSIDYFYKALDLFQKLENYRGAVVTLNNMAWAYTQSLDYKKGIEQGFKGIELAKKISEADHRNRLLGYLYNNVSIAFLELGMADSALKYNYLAYKDGENPTHQISNHLAWIYAQFGNIYSFQKDDLKAELYFKKVVEVKDSAVLADAVVFAISRYCHLLNRLNRCKEAIELGKFGIHIARKGGGIRYLVEVADELRYSSERLNQLEMAYTFSKLATELRDSIFDAKKAIQYQNMSLVRELKASELKFEVEKAQAYEKLKGAQLLKNIFLGGLVLMMVFAGIFLYQRNKIKAGKSRSDELLLNILPAEVAEELKNKGSTLAKQFENVTVMFTDFHNFTQISEKLLPQELVNEIHTCFKAFDQIIEKYGIEKIKTIGDAYMCAGGLPVSNQTHAYDVVSAAIEIKEFMQKHSEERLAQGKELFEIRIGIHSGPVVAGIVGIKKFAYDIWGDTVNTASRLESCSEKGKVNLSGTTYEQIKHIGIFRVEPRGKIEAKGKGAIEMFYVERIA
jgi:class 3 adenylate cyclase